MSNGRTRAGVRSGRGAAPLLGYALVAWLLPTVALAQGTVVSLTFDDTLEDQGQVGAILAPYGLKATFYVNSARVGEPRFMSLEQLLQLQAAGHEIGGHTVNHVDVPSVDAEEQRRQVCTDRAQLLEMGFAARSFAFPRGRLDDASMKVVAECGYLSGRDVGGLQASSCPKCPVAESMTPPQRFAIRTPSSVIATTTLDELKDYVTRTEAAGGGWVPLVFHHVCDGCNPLSIKPTDLAAFAEWLAARAAQGTTVKLVHDVVAGDVLPPVWGPPQPLEREGNLLRNPSLDGNPDTDDVPDCWQHSGQGNNSFQWSWSDEAHSGALAQRLEILEYTDGFRRLVTRQDLGSCAPKATPGQVFELSAWYKSTAPLRFAVHYRTALGAWHYWSQSGVLPASGEYVQATWRTPAVPSEAVAVSMGVTLATSGAVTLDDLTMKDVTDGAARGCACGSASGAFSTALLPVLGWALAALARRRRRGARPG